MQKSRALSIRAIPGYEGLYSCNSHGHIWSHRSEKFLVQHAKDGIYPGVSLYDKNGNKKTVRVPRIVAKTWVHNFSSDMEVHHKDRDPWNNHVDNLECLPSHRHQVVGLIDKHPDLLQFIKERYFDQ